MVEREDMHLDAEEQEILAAFELDEIKLAPDQAAELQKHRQSAAATVKRNKRISVRLSSKDWRVLQKRALAEGLSDQALIASILHKYVEGHFVEKR